MPWGRRNKARYRMTATAEAAAAAIWRQFPCAPLLRAAAGILCSMPSSPKFERPGRPAQRPNGIAGRRQAVRLPISYHDQTCETKVSQARAPQDAKRGRMGGDVRAPHRPKSGWIAVVKGQMRSNLPKE